MAVVNKPVPSIPTPTIPKRTRSLGATESAEANSGSACNGITLAASEALATPADVCKNSRREKWIFFMRCFSFGVVFAFQ
jgi:hypothetical protein